MLSKKIRYLGMLILPTMPFIVEWWVLTSRSFIVGSPKPTLVVCGDFSHEESFAVGVYEAVQRVALAGIGDHGAPFSPCRLDDKDDATSDTFRQEFLDVISRAHVAAIISANTSENAKAVLRLAETFRIPTLIAVATNDAVLDRRAKHALRLVPRDTKQAEAICNWAVTYEDVLILFDQSDYGEFLSGAVASAVESKDKQVLRCAFDTASTASEMIRALHPQPDPKALDRPGNDAVFSPGAVIYAGYFAELADVLRLLNAVGTSVPLLVSDGCYFRGLSALAERYAGGVFLSFPVDVRVSPRPGRPDFGSYGRDAAIIIRHALIDADERGVVRERLIESVRRVLEEHVIAPEDLTFAYQYATTSETSMRAENLKADFRVSKISSPSPVSSQPVTP